MGFEFHVTVGNSALIKAEKNNAVTRAMEKVGIHLEGEAADELENSPRRVDTGRLKGSITHQSDATSCSVGTNVEYAIYVHFGTYKMDANAFLKNAFERNMDQVRQFILNELQA